MYSIHQRLGSGEAAISQPSWIPNQGCATVPAMWGPSLSSVSHTGVHLFSCYATLPDNLGYKHKNTLTFGKLSQFLKAVNDNTTPKCRQAYLKSSKNTRGLVRVNHVTLPITYLHSVICSRFMTSVSATCSRVPSLTKSKLVTQQDLLLITLPPKSLLCVRCG